MGTDDLKPGDASVVTRTGRRAPVTGAPPMSPNMSGDAGIALRLQSSGWREDR